MKNNDLLDEDYGKDMPQIDEDDNWVGQLIAAVVAVGFLAIFVAIIIRIVKWIIGF